MKFKSDRMNRVGYANFRLVIIAAIKNIVI